MNNNILDDILNNKYGKLLLSQRIVNKNKLYISYVLKNNCNYNCSYCLNKNTKEKYILKEVNKNIKLRNIFNKNTNSYFYDIKYIQKFIYYLNYLNINKNDIRISILGGEPTLCKNLYEIVELFINNNYHISLITNGSKPVYYFENFLNNFKDIWYEISFHPEFGISKHFIDLENMFNKYKYINYNIRILLYENFSDCIIELYNQLKNKNKIELTMLNDDKKISNKFNSILNKDTTYSYRYKLDFENKKNVILNERDMVYLGNRSLFKGMKCTMNKNFYTFTNNMLLDICNNKIFDINNFNEFIKYFNKDYIICNNNICNLDCKLSAKKYV